jgi:acetyl-CoA carboxylase biotin carboxylase subunit/3-methylcrotonyl-CoA carboxylase alpha subunit
MVTGIDLVEQQIRVAAGERLAPEILSSRPTGHSIEVRVYAEDPAKKFAPQPGTIQKLVWPAPDGDLRIETGVREGSEVTPFYDPMIAKIVASGRSRAEAIARLDQALAQTTLTLVGAAGPASTNLDFLRRILQAEAFVGGRYDTLFAEALAKQKR